MASDYWVTVRLAMTRYALTDMEVAALPSILVEAPNGISWQAVGVSGLKLPVA